MNLRSKRALLPAVVCTFIAFVWLNQSVGGKEWEALRDRVFASPREHVVDYVRYPFIFLYRRSHDEEIYFATARAICGKSYDPAFLDRGPVPASFARAMPAADGHWHAPYVEVPFEYPPLALPFIVLPCLLTSTLDGYERLLGAMMAACLVGAMAIAIRIAERGEGGAERTPSRWWFAAALCLAHGAIAIQRLDAIVALFMALALRAAVYRKPVSLGIWVGFLGAAKFVPLLLLPIFIAADRAFLMRRGRLFQLGAAAFATLVAGLGPILLVPPVAIKSMFEYHASRGLQIESTLGILYGCACALVGHPANTNLDFGSFNFESPLSHSLARASTGVTLVAILAVTALVAQKGDRTANDEQRVTRIACAALAGAAALWLSGKVFSPQYLTWGIPLLLAIPGITGRRLTVTGIVAIALSQIYLRGFYDYVYEQRPLGLVTLAVRQAALLIVLIVALRASQSVAASRVGEVAT